MSFLLCMYQLIRSLSPHIYIKLLFPQYIFFLLCSMVIQLHIHVYILFPHIIMLHHK